VARSVAAILADPDAHVGRIYNLTGPENEDLDFYAGEYAAALGRPVRYREIPAEAWRERLLGFQLPRHLVDHVTAMAGLNREGRYDRLTDEVRQLTGEPPMRLREFVRENAAAFTA
jgi:uncharacterized protein YbjT (DUF2867 family)